MPHTMPKAPTPTTPRWTRRAVYKSNAHVPKPGIATPHNPGETGRQLANRLRAEAAEAAKPKRKPRAKKATADTPAT